MPLACERRQFCAGHPSGENVVGHESTKLGPARRNDEFRRLGSCALDDLKTLVSEQTREALSLKGIVFDQEHDVIGHAVFSKSNPPLGNSNAETGLLFTRRRLGSHPKRRGHSEDAERHRDGGDPTEPVDRSRKTRSPITDRRRTSSIMIAITGAAKTPLMPALQ